MFLLDTNVLSELMRPEPEARVMQWADQISRPRIFTSAIVRAEVETGLAKLPHGQKRALLEQRAKLMFAHFAPNRCLPFDESCAAYYAALVTQRDTAGRPIQTSDALIAATALRFGLTVVTRNTKDFEGIAGLTLVNPWDLSL